MQLVAATEEREAAQLQIQKLEAELEAAQLLLEDQKQLLAGQSAILSGDVQDARAAAARVGCALQGPRLLCVCAICAYGILPALALSLLALLAA